MIYFDPCYNSLIEAFNCNILFFVVLTKDDSLYCIAYPYCTDNHPGLLQHAHINKMVPFLKGLAYERGLIIFFLGNNYQDLTNFLFSLNAVITIFLYSELCDYRPISIAE